MFAPPPPGLQTTAGAPHAAQMSDTGAAACCWECGAPLRIESAGKASLDLHRAVLLRRSDAKLVEEWRKANVAGRASEFLASASEPCASVTLCECLGNGRFGGIAEMRNANLLHICIALNMHREVSSLLFAGVDPELTCSIARRTYRVSGWHHGNGGFASESGTTDHHQVPTSVLAPWALSKPILGCTALLVACVVHSLEILRELIDLRVNVLALASDGDSEKFGLMDTLFTFQNYDKWKEEDMNASIALALIENIKAASRASKDQRESVGTAGGIPASQADGPSPAAPPNDGSHTPSISSSSLATHLPANAGSASTGRQILPSDTTGNPSSRPVASFPGPLQTGFNTPHALKILSRTIRSKNLQGAREITAQLAAFVPECLAQPNSQFLADAIAIKETSLIKDLLRAGARLRGTLVVYTFACHADDEIAPLLLEQDIDLPDIIKNACSANNWCILRIILEKDPALLCKNKVLHGTDAGPTSEHHSTSPHLGTQGAVLPLEPAVAAGAAGPALFVAADADAVETGIAAIALGPGDDLEEVSRHRLDANINYSPLQIAIQSNSIQSVRLIMEAFNRVFGDNPELLDRAKEHAVGIAGRNLLYEPLSRETRASLLEALLAWRLPKRRIMNLVYKVMSQHNLLSPMISLLIPPVPHIDLGPMHRRRDKIWSLLDWCRHTIIMGFAKEWIHASAHNKQSLRGFVTFQIQQLADTEALCVAGKDFIIPANSTKLMQWCEKRGQIKSDLTGNRLRISASLCPHYNPKGKCTYGNCAQAFVETSLSTSPGDLHL